MPFASDKPFTISQVSDKLWRLEEEVVYYDSEHTSNIISIGKGFIADGSSIPRIVWSIIGHPLEGNHSIVGFLHDKLYRYKMFSRKICDLIYLEAHKNLGTSFIKRHLGYRALRLFGWYAYNL
jgi:hypothetical protein